MTTVNDSHPVEEEGMINRRPTYGWLDILINHHIHIQNATQAQEERHPKCHNKITLPAHHRDSSVRRATLADIRLA